MPIQGGGILGTDVHVEPHKCRLVGQVRKGICSKHQTLGVQFVPDYWRQDCQFCYDKDDFYSEVVRTALYGLGTVQEEAKIDEVVESATSTFGATPPSFESRLREFLEERTEYHQ